ncbi:MAG: class I SAM-dependent methyltransferase, partial [Patulibacter minatonensis]
RVIGIDWDPALLRLAAESVGTERAGWIELDLVSPDWPARLLEATFGEQPLAAVSSTALHWLTPPQLTAVYASAAQVLAPRGVLLNADHLRFGADRPTLKAVAGAHDAATQERSFAEGALTWDAWWQELRAAPDFAPLVEERDRRFGARADGIVPATVEFHLAALRQAGFGEQGTVWQLHDDYVVFGRL